MNEALEQSVLRGKVGGLLELSGHETLSEREYMRDLAEKCASRYNCYQKRFIRFFGPCVSVDLSFACVAAYEC